jgi:3-dehydroshikimate dehydratase
MESDRWPLSAFGDEVADGLEEQIEVLVANRVEHVEFRNAGGISVVDLDDTQLNRAHTILTGAGVGVSAIGSPIGKTPIEGDFEIELGRFRRVLTAAERLDTRLVRVFSFYINDGQYGKHRDEVLRRMSALAREAETRGLTLVHENESYIFGDTAERCRDLVEGVASSALRIAFDPANFVQVGVAPMGEAWPLLHDYVVHVHIKDAVQPDRTGLEPYSAPLTEEGLMNSVRITGEGEGGLPEMLRALAREDYQGFLTLEPHLRHRLPELSDTERFQTALAALRRLLNQTGSRE